MSGTFEGSPKPWVGITIGWRNYWYLIIIVLSNHWVKNWTQVCWRVNAFGPTTIYICSYQIVSVFDSICIIFGGTTKSSTPLSHLRNQCCGKWSPNILAMQSWCFTFLARGKCITKLVLIWWTQKEDPGFHLVAVSISGGFNPSRCQMSNFSILSCYQHRIQR